MRERPTLLLLHGGPGGDHTTFKPEMSELIDVAQVVYLEHRSQGRSDRTGPERWNLAAWADDVVAFCEALEIEHPVVMGTSFGGMAAMAYATRHPEHPGKLILCSTAARWRMERVFAEFERLGGPEARAIAESYWKDPTPEHAAVYLKVCMPLYTRNRDGGEKMGRVKWNIDVATHFAGGEQRTMNMLAALSRIRCPTLVLAGEDDPVTPISESEDIVAALPEGLVRFERFPNAGHGVVTDAPRRAIEVIREFVASQA